MNEPQVEVDRAIRVAYDGGDFQAAATQALEAYGQEVLSFLAARLRSQSDGEEAFSIFAEDMWKGLPNFAFRCSVRAWLYALARNAANRYASAPHNRYERSLSAAAQRTLSAFIERARSVTDLPKRTDTKAKVRALRDRLALEDQTLLILHIDRGLPWRELALVMHEQHDPLDDEALAREAARLRKRFERLKSELRSLAVAEGLLGA